jgi:hypothetical protein
MSLITLKCFEFEVPEDCFKGSSFIDCFKWSSFEFNLSQNFPETRKYPAFAQT